MAEAFLQAVLDKLSSLIQEELGLLWGVDQEVQKLHSTLSTIKDVLEDAEKRQVREKAIKGWLRKLKDAAYDADDILDEFATEAARSGFESQKSGAIERVTSFMTCLTPKNIMFRHKIANRMKEVGKRLDQIAEERMKFHLQQTVTERRDEVIAWRQTGSIMTQPVVYGRDEDHKKIVNYLVEEVVASDDVSVYPIVGIGGLGKTTLAQLVFNDERVRRHFELRSWVCISDAFDERRVLKAIIESASGNSCEELDLDPLQRQLQDMLRGRRYLIVLDDVWNEDQENWDRLKYVLACGSKGASIIVTSRLNTVASIVGTISAHHLSGLSNDDCWLLFKERAFGYEVAKERPSLVAIGKEMVRKCGGVPLAAKALGGLLCFTNEESQWRHVLDSELWNLPEEGNSILPALRLSYFNLPLQLRQCFAYCAIFPKDYKIEKRLLIYLWTANGFISSYGNLEVEEIGNKICKDLYWRSLFQDEEKDEFGDILNFKMHDLVHDLAQSVMEDECYAPKPGRSIASSRRTHHVMIPDYPKELFTNVDAVYKLGSLRTLHVDWYLFSGNWDVFIRDSSKLCKFHSLRVLSTPYSGWEKLSSSIGNLNHLRYLDLSHSYIKTLPKSICSLWNLQNLKLEKCSYLKKLPNQMRCLKNLRHLSIRGCSSLSYMPPKIGQLTCLKTLSMFIVGKRRACHLVELQKLDLGGELCIKHLERVGNPVDAKEAHLAGKSNLHNLTLIWENKGKSKLPEYYEQVLESLEPHPNIKMLKIEGYRGTYFPHWMSEAILGNLVSIKLIKCKECIEFPPLGKLPSLKDLHLEEMDFVAYLDNETYTEVARIGFPSLETLEISNLKRLEKLARDDRRELLPRLSTLNVKWCPKLSFLPLLTALKSLKISFSHDVALFNSISTLTSLNSLGIAYNSEVISFPNGMLRNLIALQRLAIDGFPKLRVLPENLVGLNSLEELTIRGCHELESLPGHGLQDLNSLRCLEIWSCTKLKSLSGGIHHLTSLKRLTIGDCPQLAVISDYIKYLVSLQRLTLWGLPKLVILPEGLAHIPALQHLEIVACPNLASLPNSLGNLTSLRSLHIAAWPKLSSLPTVIQNLTNLKELKISGCHELLKRCKKPTGEEWYKIAHIPQVYLNNQLQK